MHLFPARVPRLHVSKEQAKCELLNLKRINQDLQYKRRKKICLKGAVCSKLLTCHSDNSNPGCTEASLIAHAAPNGNRQKGLKLETAVSNCEPLQGDMYTDFRCSPKWHGMRLVCTELIVRGSSEGMAITGLGVRL